MTNRSSVSLFAGCGGFCEGIERAGFEVLQAVEWDKYACETYRFNFPRTPLFDGDVKDFHPGGQKRFANVDLVFGGPPCQGFSQIGARDVNDDRNQLYMEFARVIAELRPRMFLMENVPNLAMMRGGYFKKLILNHFRELGYSNAVVIKVTASDYGVPQVRQRIVFVGTRDEEHFPFDMQSFCDSFLSQKKMAKPYTVGEAIDDLPAEVVHSGEVAPYPKAAGLSRFQKMMRLDYDAQPYTKTIKKERGIGKQKKTLFNHHTKEIQARRAHLISLLGAGQKADSLPKEIWDGKRPEKWRRLHPDLPSYTILAHMHRDLSEWVHPRLNRWITVREAARLQSFHDGFIFQGSEWQQLKQIGNAVPPLLGLALGELAENILSQLSNKPLKGKAKSRTPAMIQRVFIEEELAVA